jgi:hypothetical protein
MLAGRIIPSSLLRNLFPKLALGFMPVINQVLPNLLLPEQPAEVSQP